MTKRRGLESVRKDMGVHHEVWCVRGSHGVWNKKEEAHWEACVEKTAAELIELCGDLPNPARIRERCLDLNCDWEC